MVSTDMPSDEPQEVPACEAVPASEPAEVSGAEPGDAFATLGADLLLLSIRPRDGKLMTARRIAHGLMGSELIRLAAIGRIDIAGNRIVVRDPAATGDAELDAALSSLVGLLRPPRPEAWVGLPRRRILNAYVGRLTAAGVLRVEPGRRFGGPRYRITAPERLADARSRIDAVANFPGRQVDVGQAALAGLASAIGLGSVLYPGQAGRPRRAHLARISSTQARQGAGSTSSGSASAGSARAGSVDAGATGPGSPGSGATAIHAAISAATSAAVHAATSAAVNGAQSAGGRGPSPLGAGGHGVGGFGGQR
jgi:hypothetical protein